MLKYSTITAFRAQTINEDLIRSIKTFAQALKSASMDLFATFQLFTSLSVKTSHFPIEEF